VVFNELNIVVTIVGSWLLLSRKYKILQWIAGLVAVGGGLIPLFSSSDSVAISSNIPFFVWYILYIVGTVPIALANIFTENIVKVTLKPEELSQINSDEVNLVDGETLPLVPKPKFAIRISQLYFFSNIWSLFFVLVLFWVPGMAYTDNFWKYFTEGTVCIVTFCNKGVLWLWLASLFSWIGTWCAASITREDDVTMATLIMTVAPFLTAAVFGLKPIFGGYYIPVHWTDWLSLGVIAIAVILYKVPVWYKRSKGDEKDEIKPKNRLNFVHDIIFSR